MQLKLAAIVVLYHPPENVVENIHTYATYTDRIYLINNSSVQTILFPDSWKNKLTIINNDDNYGVAKALNQGMQLAIKDGFEWVMTMDQDSSFGKHKINNYLHQVIQHQQEKIAMYGPGYGNSIAANTESIQVNRMITSGAIINTKAYIKTGPFNEQLFIDEVDHEYCYRLRLLNYTLMQFPSIQMEHRLGEKGNSKLTESRSFHSPIRLYYMIRNGLWIIKKYRAQFPVETSRTRKDILIRIKNNLFFGQQKWQCLHYILKGIIDYRKNKFGKL